MYRLAVRKGRCVQVSYDDGKTWKSTGCKTKEEAIAKLNGQVDVTLNEYAKNFYIRKDENSWYFRKILKNKPQSRATIRQKQTRLNWYILPRFGSYNLRQIKAREIDAWFVGVKAKTTGKLLSSQARDMILYQLMEILDKALTDGLVEVNEARKCKPITIRHVKRATISPEEMEILFPKDDKKLLENFENNPRNALFFCIMKDTGFRPSEVLGLMWDDIREDHSVYTERSYNMEERKIVERIKTTNTGQKYKVGFLSEQTLRIMKLHSNRSSYIFYTKDGNVLDDILTNKYFKRACSKVLGREDLTQYCIRHAFMTNLVVAYPRELVMELMGHVQWESCYDDRTPEQVIETITKKFNINQKAPLGQ